MRKIKRTASIALCIAVLMLLSSCGMRGEIIINDDMSLTGKITSYIEKIEDVDEAEVKAAMEELGFEDMGKTEINGKEFSTYVIQEDESASEAAAELASYDDDKIVLSMGKDEYMESVEGDEAGMDFCDIIITAPKEIKKTNGILSDDRKSITIDMLKNYDERYYMVFDDSIINDTTIKLNAVNGKYYNKKFTLKAKSTNVITSFTVNGEPIDTNEFVPAKDGRYKVNVELLSGASKKISYVLDRTKPYTNIVNNKTYKKSVTVKFSDKYGVKKAFLNKKAVKTGRKITKAGSYTLKVYDKAGNVTIRKFKVK